MQQQENPEPVQWPVGGGEMGGIIRSLDWSESPLGPVRTWPQSLRTAVDLVLACPVPMIILWGQDLVQIYNDAIRFLIGDGHPAGLGRKARDVWPDHWRRDEPLYEQVFQGEVLTVEDQLCPLVRDGAMEDAYFTFCYSPLRTEATRVGGILLTVLETTQRINAEAQRREIEQHQKIVLAELQHRVRNTLAVIRSIARRTAETSETVEEFSSHFDGRVNAFARTQAVVTRDPAAGVDLEFLVADELATHAAHEGDQVTVSGPKVRLRPKAAETFGLAMHELSVNAVKYGALSSPDGMIHVAWRIQGDDSGPRLQFAWIETGMSGLPSSLRRRGFGTELLEKTLKYELGATTSMSVHPSGLTCRIELPLTPRIAVTHATDHSSQ